MGAYIFKELINSITIYGLDFSLLYKKEKNYSTFFDILLSIIFITLFISVTIIYFEELFDNSNMTVISNFLPTLNKEIINLSYNPIIISFVNSNKEITNIDTSMIKMRIFKVEHNILDNLIIERNQTELEYEKCDPLKFPDNFTLLFNNLNNISYCIKKDQNLSIAGRYGDFVNGFDLLEIHFEKCKNSSFSNIICKSSNEINDYISNSIFLLNFLSWRVDHLNASYPINPYLYSDILMNSLNVVKRYFYYFSPSIYYSDHGLILNSNKKIQFYEFRDKFMDFIEYEKSNDFSETTFFECILTCYPEMNIYNRKYTKIQDVLGNIGGCVDFICIVLKYISYYFSEKSFLIEFSNSLMDSSSTYKNKKRKNNFNIYSNQNENKRVTNFINKLTNVNEISSKFYLNYSPKGLSIPNKITNTHINNFFDSNNKIQNFNEVSSVNNIGKKDTYQNLRRSKSIKGKLTFNIFDYCIPFFLMEKCNHKNILNCYENIFKKYLSIEIMIPLLERISTNYINLNTSNKINVNKNGYFFKFNPFFLNSD